MKKVLVLGGTGFVGRHVCEQLTRAGIRVTVPTRRAINAQHVQMLPMVDVQEANVHDEAALQRLLPGHDAVVNLVAVLHGSHRNFDKVHVELPQKLARAMQASGVRRLVHISAIGADVKGPSNYLQSKGAGEAALQAAGLQLTILRPSVIFGAEDKFMNLFARLQNCLPLVPLAGADVKFQPVWVGDVAQAVLRCLQQPEQTVGQTYELGGAQVFTLRELVQLAGKLSGHPRPVIGIPLTLGWLQAGLMEILPGEPMMSTDNVCSLMRDNVASGQLPGLEAFDIIPAALEPTAARYLDLQGQADPLLQVRLRARR